MTDDHAVATRLLLGLGLLVVGVALFDLPGVPVAWLVGVGAIYWTVGVAGGVLEAGGRTLREPREATIVSLLAVLVSAVAILGAGAIGGGTGTVAEQIGMAAALLAPALAFPLGLANQRTETLLFGALVGVGLGWAAIWAARTGGVDVAAIAVVGTVLCSVPTAAYGRHLTGRPIPLLAE